MRTQYTLALVAALALAGTASSAFAADKMGGSPCNTTAAAQDTTTGSGPAGSNAQSNTASSGHMAKSGGMTNSAKGSEDRTTGSGPAGSNNDKSGTSGKMAAKSGRDC